MCLVLYSNETVLYTACPKKKSRHLGLIQQIGRSLTKFIFMIVKVFFDYREDWKLGNKTSSNDNLSSCLTWTQNHKREVGMMMPLGSILMIKFHLN